MQFSESWLRTRVDPDISSDELGHRLTMAGLEVEDAVPAAPPFTGVVVAQIVEIAPHPDADKLRVCQVDDGSGTPLQIVCGAPNAAQGLKVPLARVGAELPGGLKIGVAKMRGVASSGMLCSARELGLSQDHAGLMELGADAPVGQSLRDALGLDDTVFTLKLTPNRADCLSILGVAREVAALTGAPLNAAPARAIAIEIDDQLPVQVAAPDLCGRFAGRIIRGVDARATTPDWMRQRLERAGQRSISALVDISNYVMLELGRPTHVFDLDTLPAGGLTVRWARADETLELLNGQRVTLDPSVGVVAAGEQVESLAGIMGGQASSVTLETRNIYVEAAFWWPDAIAGRARRYRFSSEASHRFERGVDYANIPEHLDAITALIQDICGGQAGPLDDQVINLPERAPVRLRAARCARVLGVAIASERIADIFARLGLPARRDGDDFLVTPPSYRFDLRIEEDLIEEVARLFGFENLPDRPPLARAKMLPQPESARGPHALRHALAALDYQEVINFSFVPIEWERDYAGNDEPIRLLNPIASQLAVMRSSLLGGLLANIVHNANRKQSRVRVFELGRVFARDARVAAGDLSVGQVRQPLHVAGAAWGLAADEQWGQTSRQVDFYDVKRDVELLFGARLADVCFVAAAHPALHPGRSARIDVQGAPAGWLGELHPRWVQQAGLQHTPVVFELALDALLPTPVPAARELSRQPVVVRDLAVWAPAQVQVQALLDTIAQTAQNDPVLAVLQDARLFDVWRDPAAGPGAERSLALRFWLQDPDVTLDDARVDDCMTRLRLALAQRHGVRLRT